MKFSDIKLFPFAAYRVNIPWIGLIGWLEDNNSGIQKLELDPPYQRGYVWSEFQKTAYVEYQLRGGFSGKDVFWNCPTWMHFTSGKASNIIELVDGKQRIQAVLDFLNNKVKAFGIYYAEFEDKLPFVTYDFKFHINNLQTPIEVVEWYIGFNTGGSVHTEKDLQPAYDYLARLQKKGKRNGK